MIPFPLLYCFLYSFVLSNALRFFPFITKVLFPHIGAPMTRTYSTFLVRYAEDLTLDLKELFEEDFGFTFTIPGRTFKQLAERFFELEGTFE